jgi:hypothetical protein
MTIEPYGERKILIKILEEENAVFFPDRPSNLFY